MGDSSKDRKKWQEDIYWTRFRCIYFYSHLTTGYHEQLAIPKKFANKLRNRLPETVVLRGPSGATWTVEVCSNGDRMFFKNGWPEFVKDHSLKLNDLLNFRFNGESSFDVLVFDPRTYCEKEASYFFPVGEEAAGDSKDQIKRQMEETYVLVASSQDDNGSDSSADESGNEDSVSTPSEKSNSDYSFHPELSCHYSDSHDRKKIRREVDETRPAHSRRAKTKSTAARRLGDTSGFKVKYPCDALMAATSAANSTSDSEVVVMQPRHVDRIFRVGMRRRWVAKHLTPETQKLILRRNGKYWFVGLYYHKTNKTGELTTGWKKFAFGNDLEVFDVCVFAPAGRSEDGILILDVSIFPAAKEEPPSVHGLTSAP